MIWLIDFGASFHMTSRQHWFSVSKKCNGGMVYLGDYSSLSIVLRGRVLIRFPDGTIKDINGFFHILGLAQS
jgi:hypothetical protein